MKLIDVRLLKFAREMRHDGAPAEQRLWKCLRDRQLNGYKFRRQRPIGRYVADFVCVDERLIIELDGDSHDVRQVYDQARTDALQSLGYRVLRFTNVDVLENLDGVLNEILRQLEEFGKSPSPLPSPRTTEERE